MCCNDARYDNKALYLIRVFYNWVPSKRFDVQIIHVDASERLGNQSTITNEESTNHSSEKGIHGDYINLTNDSYYWEVMEKF